MKTKIMVRNFLVSAMLLVSQFAFSQNSEKESQLSDKAKVRDLQVSILPYLVINQQPSDEPVNVSINILAGHVSEVRKFEVGYIFNSVKGNAGKCQLSGVGNFVGETSEGLQGAGVFNVSKNLNGAQMAGVLNVVGKEANYGQFAGVGNVVGGSIKGIQGAGVFNVANNSEGIQLAGVLNISANDAGPAQMAGVANYCRSNISGIQSSGVFNFSKSLFGIQSSGVVNIATDTVIGLQAAGVLNYATYVKGLQISGAMNLAFDVRGTQIGLVNIADTCSGVPIGLFSFVNKGGYHKIEVSSDDIFYTNIAFRTGVKAFHNIFTASIKPDNLSKSVWSFGYGIGTSLGRSGKMLYDIDITMQHIGEPHRHVFDNQLGKIYFGIDRKIFSKVSIAMGISYNVLASNINSDNYNTTYSKLAPYTIFEKNYSVKGYDVNIKSWVGGKIALRFL
jgi:hypothetical protein